LSAGAAADAPPPRPPSAATGAETAITESPAPAEATALHTRILRCMLAVDDSYAYWQHADLRVPPAERAALAFEQRWFGTKSEARVRTLLTDMAERFDAYPEAIALLHEFGTIPASLRPLLCHLHTQLADPLYRRFTGEMLPTRREHGLTTLDRDTVTRWVDSLAPGRWSSTTAIKFASNLLATALDAGIVEGRRDPRKLTVALVPESILGYALYLLRDVRIEGSLTENPYLRSLGVTAELFRRIAPRIPGIRFAAVGGVTELSFLEPSLRAFGRRHLRVTE